MLLNIGSAGIQKSFDWIESCGRIKLSVYDVALSKKDQLYLELLIHTPLHRMQRTLHRTF